MGGLIEAELALYRSYQPDHVPLNYHRPSAGTAVDMAGVPVAMLKVYMRNLRRIPLLSEQQ